MAFKVIQVFLTEDQIKAIKTGVGPNGDHNKYALLAEPKPDVGVLNVQVVTEKQYDILKSAIIKAQKLPTWKSRNGNKEVHSPKGNLNAI